MVCTVPPFRVPILSSLSGLAEALIYMPPPLVMTRLGLSDVGVPGPDTLVGRVCNMRRAVGLVLVRVRSLY